MGRAQKEAGGRRREEGRGRPALQGLQKAGVGSGWGHTGTWKG